MTNDVHTLSGAYALDSLSPQEAAEFREHLRVCQACWDEVTELREAAALMGAAESVVPPQHLRQRILAAADRLPQQPPATGVVQIGARPPAPRRPQRWLPRVAVAAAAVVLMGGGALGVRSVLDQEPELAYGAAQVFEAGDVREATVETSNGGSLTVGVSLDRNEMAVDTRDLPELDNGHVYQIWSVHGDRMASAAILTDSTPGAAMGLPEEGTQVALTVEPAGGSEQPTTEPIVVVDPAQVV